MRTLTRWTFRLVILGALYLVMNSGIKIKLPPEVLGYKVPPAAQQWVDRYGQIGEYGKVTENRFKAIANALP
jgi:hypothetical protein